MTKKDDVTIVTTAVVAFEVGDMFDSRGNNRTAQKDGKYRIDSVAHEYGADVFTFRSLKLVRAAVATIWSMLLVPSDA